MEQTYSKSFSHLLAILKMVAQNSLLIGEKELQEEKLCRIKLNYLVFLPKCRSYSQQTGPWATTECLVKMLSISLVLFL